MREPSDRIWTIPNLISMARLALVPVFAILLANRQDIAALIVVAVSGASDWLDGVIARKFDQTSRLGAMLDPAADRLLILVTLIALAWRDIIPVWLAVAIIARDVLMFALLPSLAKRGYGMLPVHFLGKAGTFCLLYAFPLLLLGQFSGPVGLVAQIVGWAFAGWGIALYWLSMVMYVRQWWQLVHDEPVDSPST